MHKQRLFESRKLTSDNCFEVKKNLFDKPTAAYELTSRLFMRAILNQTGWDANCSYRLNGRYSEELGVVSFDMNQPERIDAMPPQYQES